MDLPLLSRVGLLIIGDELLSGRRRDGHLQPLAAYFTGLGVTVAWAMTLGDDRGAVTAWLRRSRGEGLPVFCCGGIGATPDDHTRQAAAAAWETPLIRHPEAAALIIARFGPEAHPHRIRMADLPAGCALIPNPVNTIPGFSLDHHHFLPGFPEMAHPMAAWVTERRYRVTGRGMIVRWLVSPNAREGEMTPIFEEIEALFPGVVTYSLPGREYELGVKGMAEGRVEAAYARLRERLLAGGGAIAREGGEAPPP